MKPSSYVRLCPFCSDHPPFLPNTLQCGHCGAPRPMRASSVTWHSCPPEAEEKIQDALDRVFHSAAPESGKASLEVECGPSRYRILNALIVRPESAGGPPTGSALIIAQVLADAGIPVVASGRYS